MPSMPTAARVAWVAQAARVARAARLVPLGRLGRLGRLGQLGRAARLLPPLVAVPALGLRAPESASLLPLGAVTQCRCARMARWRRDSLAVCWCCWALPGSSARSSWQSSRGSHRIEPSGCCSGPAVLFCADADRERISILSPTSVSFSTITGISEPAAFAQLLTEAFFAPHLPAVAVHRVRTRPGRRLEAPRALWNVYEVEIDLPDGQRTSRLVWTKAFFNGEDCQEYHSRIQGLLDRLAFNPLDADGYATFIPTYNLFVFFFPVDPVFPMLSTAFDGRRIKPILAPHFRHLLGIDSADSIDIERVKYLPEISAIARYRAAGAGSGPAIYGKVQHSRKGAFTYEVMQALWALPARSSGELVIAEPLGYYPEYDLLLQSEVPGDDITGDRHSEVFMAQAEAAGRVIGRIHQSGITVGRPHTIDVEIERLMTRLEEFKLSSPSLYLLIRGLLNQIVARARGNAPESPVPSHGDYKYNQFLYDGQRFGLIDVEYFV